MCYGEDVSGVFLFLGEGAIGKDIAVLFHGEATLFTEVFNLFLAKYMIVSVSLTAPGDIHISSIFLSYGYDPFGDGCVERFPIFFCKSLR